MSSRRTILQAAKQSDLYVPARRRRPIVTFALAAGAVLVSTAAALLAPAVGTAGGKVVVGTLTAVGIAVLSLLAQLLVEGLKPAGKQDGVEKVVEAVERSRGSQPYRAFVDRLAQDFTGEAGMRCLVVDDFGRLDPTTRDVLEAYLDHYTGGGPELWILFDGYDDAPQSVLRQLIVRQQRQRRTPGHGYRGALGGPLTELYDLLPLTGRQRRELAERSEHPERSNFLTIASILEAGEAGTTLALDALLPAGIRERDPNRFAALELLYLLSLDAMTQGKVFWSEQDLVSALIRGRLRGTVLRALLTRSPAGPSSGALDVWLRELRQVFSAWIVVDDTATARTLGVDPHLGTVLRNQWQARGLPDPRLGHLFWAVYWHDQREKDGQNPVWVERVARHLDLAGPLAGFGDELPRHESLGQVVFDALLDIARESLRLCRVRHLTRLAEMAHLMTQEPEFGTPARTRALRKVVRQAYGVLGDDLLLPLLVELDVRTGRSRERQPTSVGGSLAYLFFAGLPDKRPEVAAVAATRVRRSPALHRYAEVRGAWLALSVGPFVHLGSLPVAGAVRLALDRVAELATAAVEAVEHRSSAWTGADFITLSLSLWCWAWSGDARRLSDVIPTAGAGRDDGAAEEPAPAGADPEGERPGRVAGISQALVTTYLISARLREIRFGDEGVGEIDFVLDGLAEEMLTTTAASALTVLSRWPEEETGPFRADLEEVLALSLADLRMDPGEQEDPPALRTGTAQLLTERMALLVVTWRRLGFEHLAAELEIRSGQFGVLWRRDEAAAVSDLAEYLRVDGLYGLLSNAVVAEHAVLTSELAAELLVHGVRRAVAARFSRDLCAQLCLVAVRAAASFQTDLTDLVRFLLTPEPGNGGTALLARELAGVSGDDLEVIGAALTNLAVPGHPDCDRLARILRARLDALVTNGDGEHGLAAVLDLLDYRSAVARAKPAPPDDQTLQRWAGRRSSHFYPYILALMIRPEVPVPDERVLVEVADVLPRWRDYHRTSGATLLAETILSGMRAGRVPETAIRRDTVVRILREAHARWEANLPAERNLDILALLIGCDLEHQQYYRQHYAHWVKIRLEVDEQRKLPGLLEEGQWVLLFLDYWQLFAAFGLGAAGTADPAGAAVGDLKGERLAAERARLSRASAAPLVRDGEDWAVAAAFLHDAELLFNSRLSGDSDLEDARRLYNDAAQRAMQQMYALLDRLEAIPDGVKAILRRHRRLVLDRIDQPD